MRLIDDPHRFDGVQVIGVDEHVWRHTRRGDKYVTVIIDLTPVRDRTGPARLLDMVEGRSKQAFQQWLAERPAAWRDQIEVVAMDGFTGFKTATAEELPDAVAVMDPFHVVRLAGDALDRCRRRIQQAIHGHRGRAADPLYRARRTLHTGIDLLTDKQQQRLQTLFADDNHVQVEATWGIYQRMITAYREPDRARGRQLMVNADRLAQPRRAEAADRAQHPRPHLDETRRRRAGLLRPSRSQQRTHRGDQRHGSNTSAAPPSGSATSPTTSPDAYSKPEDSDPDYTLDSEEPSILGWVTSRLASSPSPRRVRSSSRK